MTNEEWETGLFTILNSDEDIHTANERRLKVSQPLQSNASEQH